MRKILQIKTFSKEKNKIGDILISIQKVGFQLGIEEKEFSMAMERKGTDSS